MVNRVCALWTSIKVKGYLHANVPCAYASQSKDGGTLNLKCLMTIQEEQESITKDTVDSENKTIDTMQTTLDVTNKEQGFLTYC